MELSVVVPVHNETDNVRPLIEEIDAALDPALAYEIVYVDDGSGDDTLAKLVALRAEFPRLRVLRHLRCCGQSTALRTGIRAAKGRVVATLDGDGQNNPADIPRLLAAWGELDGGAAGAMVAGYRKKRQDTEWRRLSSKIANGVRGSLLQDNTPDTGCGLKVFSRELFLALPYFDHMHRFLPALAQRAGGKVVSVEVDHRPRLRGQSKYGTWHRLWVGIWDLLGVIWLQRRAQVPDVVEVA
ncbi:glycosyltransferase family 2 protein [Methylomagnum ishizawai]|uniref:glycosyltransferase family 2 protein n=1 Tax=Methylomagnum ishizawai TaxID=1760988 RepID=UPI001C32622A|nr:glycosyltransferase family 2 protein [Methylomagnum ishizawai]BBL75146.1 dolichol-phosphate mannosyltransferase [Methylomagnum ishizawai]